MSSEKNHSKALESIELQLGTSVKTDPNSLHRSSFDGLKIGFTPQALIQPVKKEEIGKVLNVANELVCQLLQKELVLRLRVELLLFKVGGFLIFQN